MRGPRLAAPILIALGLLAGCGDDDGTTATGDAASAEPGTVRLLTHDSFALSDEVLAAFTDETGIEVELLSIGDAGAMVNQAILTKDDPQADVLFGIDNTLLSRGLEAGLFEAYETDAVDQLASELVLDPEHRVTPIDYSDVCVNYDKRVLGGAGGPPAPATLDDLTQPGFEELLVVENPATSSPGLAFLLATVARYGEEGWQAYWQALRANGVAVVEGWEQAYNGEFTVGSAGTGTRPMVVSYATSPPADVIFAEPPKSETDIGVLTDGCYRQVEFAGILSGTDRRTAAEALIDFLVSERVQADIPLQMFVFPAREGTPLPAEFTAFAATVPEPLQLPPDVVAANRDEWIEEWTSIVLS